MGKRRAYSGGVDERQGDRLSAKKPAAGPDVVVVREGARRDAPRGDAQRRRSRAARRARGGAALVEAAFAFLLDREPKESILARFDLSVISRYFPEFERELPRYLRRRA